MNNDQNIKDILEAVNFIKDNIATKEDLKRFATEEDLAGFESNVDIQFLGVEKRFDILDKSISQLNNKISEFKDEIIAKIDAIVALNQRV